MQTSGGRGDFACKEKARTNTKQKQKIKIKRITFLIFPEKIHLMGDTTKFKDVEKNTNRWEN